MSELHALFGGTFDPIHFGHLRPVEALAQQTGLQKVTLLPNNVPPHRPQPEASATQRVAMLRCAIAGLPLFDIDTRELERDTPSWTVTTLENLRAERGAQQPLGFIIGQDSLLNLPKWHRWQDLLSLCHLLVCQRPGYPTRMSSPEMQRWLDQHLAHDVKQLHLQPAGHIWLAETPLYDISATEIRRRRHHNQSCDALLPAAVIDYIDRAGLYRD
ncbi:MULTISPECIES: nicotinate-nucleotide adenylyltransferase [Pantoea]|jgi:nicotinate-nucleotide adenylyltransferase|uniref:Probable nicotinate-nucleotide adenylyltransferase n=1 Tax=Pantoea brenneri TaxID=472694 RepID=A0A653VPN9_9GAMM|nr:MULTISPECIES: nicotinate-nucleotide adenylyltransferase [Pantoea]KKD34011.1 nicotinate-nucleotide adenylyltransferase [Pantoea sp. 3.5.1]MBS6032489.1 nicotinate-nucleotide adenylyltransferase [Pantoea sp.]MBZ6393770.1 nicotinate-nucleotide adenylyltransferase [Pantoea sp.]MBZ6436852.1 nicotinate-nucleotide adenylyltransferase [Pantoea sp.]MCQ5472440.1 nicotinate-nucleotide adenylyltransferase [Pantoea brenneri]